MGLSWNSWYNPLDNIASVGKTVTQSAGGFATGGQQGAKSSGPVQDSYNASNNAAGESWQAAIGNAPSAPSSPTPEQPSPAPQQTNQNNNAAQAAAEAQARAAAAEAARELEAKRNQYGVSQNNYRAGAQTGLTDVRNEYDTKSRDFWNGIGDQQGEINRSEAQNQLNLRQSMQGIVNGLQTGMRSGGVALAGMNASDSGAAEAMARAYAKVGNAQTDEARGQAMAEFEELQRAQGVLNRTRNEGETELDTWKNAESNRVKLDFATKLDTLRANAEADGLNGVIDTSLVDQVVGEAMKNLAAIDARSAKAKAGVKDWNADQVVQEAIRMEQQGMAGNPFSVREANVRYGNGNPLAGTAQTNMPLYLRNRDELTALPGRGKEQ